MQQDSLWTNTFFKKNKDETFEVIKNTPIFEGLSTRELKEIEKIVHKRQYAKGENIFQEEEPGMGMYIVKSGKVRIVTKVHDNESELAQLSVGDLFGELALLDEFPRSATAVAVEKTEVIAIFRPDFFDLMQRNTGLGLKIALKLAQMIGIRLRVANNRLKEVENKGNRSMIGGFSTVGV